MRVCVYVRVRISGCTWREYGVCANASVRGWMGAVGGRAGWCNRIVQAPQHPGHKTCRNYPRMQLPRWSATPCSFCTHFCWLMGEMECGNRHRQAQLKFPAGRQTFVAQQHARQQQREDEKQCDSLVGCDDCGCDCQCCDECGADYDECDCAPSASGSAGCLKSISLSNSSFIAIG